MLINEASSLTNLTKKAINYYTAQGLISPHSLDNSYREFSAADVDCLKKIAVLRKLGLSTEEIKQVLSDETATTLQKIAVKRELYTQREQAKKVVLDRLASGASLAEIDAALVAIEQNATITDKLLVAFPGFYGRFICLHFAPFLTHPITTAAQQAAYEEVIAFLDHTPMPPIPDELQAYLTEATNHLTVENINQLTASCVESVEHPDAFFAAQKETLDAYLAYLQSAEYKASPACKMKALLKEWCSNSGYYAVFIPAMQRLSASYAAYQQQLAIADAALLLRYPQAESL